ncbi:MAG: hypothetical protein JRJ12_06230 [Deltaproteobacteria bacterium]|nr:hypothetical protein [Deltaproteobacteria bacterium]MBW2069631.1 hypothetical protein [Deltaproteobacteria bacterium]
MSIKSLLIPVENQVREFDPKLLLAYVAAKHGFTSIIGPRREIHFRIASYPPSIYLSKSITVHSDMMFKIMHNLGHGIVAWDEEALVHLPPEIYFSRRLSPVALSYVSHLFAWGEDNAALWRQYDQLPAGAKIHVTGNPRGDLLRPEMRPFFEQEVAKLRGKYGDFILINTNFNHVNSFSPVQNLFQPTKKAGEKPRFGRAARGMTREYAEGLRDHKQAIFAAFQRLIPWLAKTFPDYNVVVRPHPTENPGIYQQIASKCQRVYVTNKGNVVPWLWATRLVIHNGCTTGVEAYVMGVPAVSYRAKINEYYDYGFYRLPNLLSHQCFDFDELQETLAGILAGKLGPAEGAERQALIEHYLASRQGPLACERMVAVLEQMAAGESELPQPSRRQRLEGRAVAAGRMIVKRCKSRLPGSHNKPAFQRYRYPGVTLPEVRAKIARFRRVLGDAREVQAEQIAEQFFRISS